MLLIKSFLEVIYQMTCKTVCPQAALVTRDSARASQQRQEGALLTEGKDRDRKLNENRSGRMTVNSR